MHLPAEPTLLNIFYSHRVDMPFTLVWCVHVVQTNSKRHHQEEERHEIKYEFLQTCKNGQLQFENKSYTVSHRECPSSLLSCNFLQTSARSNPTARRRRNHLEACKIAWQRWRGCPHSRWDRVYTDFLPINLTIRDPKRFVNKRNIKIRQQFIITAQAKNAFPHKIGSNQCLNLL